MSKPYRRGDGLWALAVELPPVLDTETGKMKRRRKVVSHKDKGTVIARGRQLLLELAEHGDLPTDSITVAQWFDYWMREVAVKTRRPSTVASYRSAVTQQIIPNIGTVRLDKLTPVTVRRVTSAMQAAGRSSTYQRNVHSVMSAAFADAERDGRVRRNPVELVVAPRKKLTQLKALTAPQAVDLIGALGDTADRYLWATYLLTGARRGEILGLEWDRVGESLDLSWQMQRAKWDHGCRKPCGYKNAAYCPSKRLAVPADYEWRPLKDGLYLTRPKSRAGWRIVPLVQPLAGYLEEWRSVAPSNPWGLAFTRTTKDGTVLPLDPDYITREWRSLADTLGHHGVRLHDLRHTAVDMLYAAGVSEQVISAIVGHSTVSMTRAYKSKGDEVRERQAMLALTKYLGL